MHSKPFLMAGLLVAGLILGSSIIAKQTALAASSIRCLRYYGTARTECLRQQDPSQKTKAGSVSGELDARQRMRGVRRNAGTPAAVPQKKYSIKNSTLLLPPVTAEDHLRGNRNAKVVLIEYIDFECPFCKRHLATTNQILKTYGNDVSVVTRHFPLPFHKNAHKEAEAAECAMRAGNHEGFWNYHDALFAKTKSGGIGFPLDQLVPLAVELGLSRGTFSVCLDSGEATAIVAAQFAAAKEAGVQGTPTTFIVNTVSGQAEKLAGALPFAQYKKVIDGMLRK